MSDKSLNMDSSDMVVMRGQTPEDIKQKCYQLCGEYLRGIWSQILLDDIVITRISDGFSNLSFRCSLKPYIITSAGQPNDVVIRIFGKNEMDLVRNDRTSDMVVTLLMSVNGLSPKLLGCFPDGYIYQFIKHRHFRQPEQTNPILVSELARKLAKLHSMVLPISFESNYVLNTIQHNLSNAYKKFPIDELIDEFDCKFLKDNDILEEWDWLRATILATDSPVCLTHNDFRGNNIMVLEEVSINSKDLLTICDFEYSGYGYRGSDFGTIYGEWDRDLDKYDWYQTLQTFPNNSTIKSFIDEYICQSIIINGNQFAEDKRNSYQHILTEVKVFTLVSNFVMVSACLAIDSCKEMPALTKGFLMEGSDSHFQNYLHLKKQFIEENVFQ